MEFLRQRYSKYVRDELFDKFEFHNYGHALEILYDAFPREWSEIQDSLSALEITTADIIKGGGNKSPMPPKFDAVLYPLGWREIRIVGDLEVRKYPRLASQGRGHFSNEAEDTIIVDGYVDGHNIDYLKDRVAFDLEWNSKDQTFDRDLLAMRTYFDCGLIDVGVIVTRSADLNDIFKALGKDIKDKYGASTTWMGKLIPRLDSRRNGGCPILAVGIRKGCVVDWYEQL